MEERCCVLNVRRALGTQSEPHHHHNGYQFLFVKQGECRVRVGQESFSVHAGDLVIFSHLELHDVQPVQEPYERYHMLLSPHHLLEEFGDRRLLGLLLNCASNGYRLTHLGSYADVADGIFQLFQEISKQGTAILMATHNYELLKKYPYRVLKCENGRLLDSKTSDISLSSTL